VNPVNSPSSLNPLSPRHREALEVSLLALPRAVPALRRQIRDHLGEASIEVQLCVSELVTNVIDHVGEGTPVTVRVTGPHGGHTRIEVTDPDPRVLPVLLRAAPADESGRGLTLLDALSLRWGVLHGTDSKTVWCELESEGPRASLPVRPPSPPG
jgi:anti-sigma regulatory factor (Ser/Thr protein kinase)